MKLFDTLRGRKIEYVPMRENQVRIYLCGPTVYDYGHLGHGRSAIVFDLLRRYLLYRGYDVVFVRNWTDIDDKTIERAAREQVSVRELTQRFIEIYREDYARLNILEPDFAPKPTDHIGDIIDFIARLFERGHAYELEDGVYYDISTFPEYGALSGQSLEELRSGARVGVDESKRNPGDFVLWKFEKPGEPAWDSPWGRGRPGWHIECSVMSKCFLGETFDIHCGGQDLIFPHHEDEIAQSRGAGYGFAALWLHNGFLNIDDEKMSKSLGNFFTLREAFERYSPPAVRYFLMSAHYRTPLNFSDENLVHAENTLRRYNGFIRRIQSVADAPARDGEPSCEERTRPVLDLVGQAREGFEAGLDDDLNISRALASIADLVRGIHSIVDEDRLTPSGAAAVLEFMRRVDSVLGVFSFEQEMLPEEIERLIEERVRAREAKEYARADGIRDELLKRGIALEDHRNGTRWKRI
jgi:cysteinyl-tRNA synthetase